VAEILAAVIDVEETCERLADLALGHLRLKTPQIQAALEGKICDHNRFLLQSLLRQLGFIETEIELLDARLDQLGREHLDLADATNRGITLPGVDRVAAWSFIAETKTDCSPFPTAAHLASWAGVFPANNQSAGNLILVFLEELRAHWQRLRKKGPMAGCFLGIAGTAAISPWMPKPGATRALCPSPCWVSRCIPMYCGTA
jgi:transposase